MEFVAPDGTLESGVDGGGLFKEHDLGWFGARPRSIRLWRLRDAEEALKKPFAVTQKHRYSMIQ